MCNSASWQWSTWRTVVQPLCHGRPEAGTGTRSERGARAVAGFGTRRHPGPAPRQTARRSPACGWVFSDLDVSARPYCAVVRGGRARGGRPGTPRGAAEKSAIAPTILRLPEAALGRHCPPEAGPGTVRGAAFHVGDRPARHAGIGRCPATRVGRDAAARSDLLRIAEPVLHQSTPPAGRGRSAPGPTVDRAGRRRSRRTGVCSSWPRL